MKKLSFYLLTILLSFSAISQNNYAPIELDDIVSYKYWVGGVWGVNPMADGEHYSMYDIDRVARTVAIKKYSYKTGEEIEKIVGLSGLGIGWVSYNYEFSADETKILLYTDDEPIYRHSFTANYWVYDLNTKKVQKVSDNGVQRIASISSDGKKVAFMRDNNLFIKDLITGDEKQITTDGEYNKIINGAPDWVYEEEFGFNKAYHWSPDGNYIAYIKFNESAVKQFSILKYAASSPHYEEYELYPGLYSFKYPKAGEKNSTVSVHVYNVQTGETKTVDIGTKADIYIPRIFWNNDGTKLVVERLNRDQNQIELLYANPADGTSNVFLTENNKYYIGDEYYDAVNFLPDNEHFTVLSERDGYRHLYLYNNDGTLVQQITNGNYDVTEFYGFNPKNKTFYYQSTETSPINRDVYSISINGKKKKKLSTSTGTNDAEFSSDCSYFINTFSNVNTPPYVTLQNNKGKVIKVLKDNQDIVNDIDALGGINKTFFKFTTNDDVELNAYRIVPPGFDSTKHHAVLVTQYSGPNSQEVLNHWNFDWENYLAQQGFVIVCVDVRGTGGRGEEFRKVTYKQLGKYETIDLVETAKYLQNLPYVDKDRIGIWGWSYGGFMVLNAMTKGNGIYNTGISVAPVTNWRYYDNVYTERYMGLPQDNAAGYDENSPLDYTDDFEGNLLLAFGTADDNVHPQNSYEFIERMVQSGKQFTAFSYPNRNHSIYGGNTRSHLYTMKTNFLIEHLKPEIKN